MREPDDFNEAFEVMGRDMPDGILMVADALTNLNRKRVFEFAAARKLPAIYEYDFIVRDGGLMSYGPDLTESFERAAAMVARSLRGREAGRSAVRAADDVSVRDQSEEPRKAPASRFRRHLLALADEVIE